MEKETKTTRSATRVQSLVAILTLVCAFVFAPGARADDPAPEGEPRHKTANSILSTIVKLRTDEPRHMLSNFHIKKRVGIAYTHSFKSGRQKYVLSVQGPVVTKKAVGLGFEIQF